jgi:hypothetical protein
MNQITKGIKSGQKVYCVKIKQSGEIKEIYKIHDCDVKTGISEECKIITDSNNKSFLHCIIFASSKQEAIDKAHDMLIEKEAWHE